MARCRPLTAGEVHRIAEQLPPAVRALWYLGVATGFRVSELLALDSTSFAWDARGNLLVTAELLKTRREAARKVTKPVPAEIAADVQEHFPVTLSRMSVWRNIKGAAAAAGVDARHVGTHCMRKTFADRLWRKHRSIELVNVALSHRSIGSTLHYINQDGDDGHTGLNAIIAEACNPFEVPK